MTSLRMLKVPASTSATRPCAPDQHHRAPAEPAMAHALARKALHQDVDVLAVELHGLASSE